MKQAPLALLRLVCSPQGTLCLDQLGRAPGRGAYVCSKAACVRKALQPAKLAFAFKRAVVAPAFATLGEEITALLQRRLEVCVQLARRAGAVISGATALQKALVQGQVVCVVMATDVAAARARDYRAWCERQHIVCLPLFSKEELGRILGKSSRSAIGFTQRHFAERLQTLVAAVEQWRAFPSAAEGRAAFFSTVS